MRISYLLAKILKKVHIPAIRNSFIHRLSKVGSFSHVVNVQMDRYSYVGSSCTILDAEIGAFCSISDNVVIGGRSHPVDWVSTSPVFYKGRNIMRTNFSLGEYNCIKKTTIGNDIWIGSNSLIKSGVTIHSGSVIGMGSVVTKDIGPYEIWAGNPAKLIRKRFSKEDIKVLLMSRWWEWSDLKIKEKAHLMHDLQGFLDACNVVSKK